MINGTEFNASDYPILNYNGSTYAPFRAMLEAAGMSVNWNAQLGQASVTNNNTGTSTKTWGTYIWPNGDKYVGEFQNNVPHGQGTYTYSYGDKYVGEFQNNGKHGQGTYTYLYGDKYAGEWQNDLRHGQGTLTFSDGYTITGTWANGEHID